MASTDSLKKGEQRSIIVMSIHFLIFLQRKNNISGTCDMRMLASKNAVLTSDVLFSQLTVKYQDNKLSVCKLVALLSIFTLCILLVIATSQRNDVLKHKDLNK